MHHNQRRIHRQHLLGITLLLSFTALAQDTASFTLTEGSSPFTTRLQTTVEEESEFCTLGEYGTECSTSRNTYKKVGDISISVEPNAAIPHAGEELTVELKGKIFAIRSKQSSNVYFSWESTQTNRRVRNTIYQTLNVVLKPREVSVDQAKIAFRNFEIKNGVLSYETGVEGEDTKTQLFVARDSLLAGWTWFAKDYDLSQGLAKVEPFAGGLRHTMRMSDLNLRLRGLMKFSLSRRVSQYGTRAMTQTESVVVRYR